MVIWAEVGHFEHHHRARNRHWIGWAGRGRGFSQRASVLEILNSMRPVVIGRDPFDLEVIEHDLVQSHGWHHFRRAGNCALGGLDISLWDVVGKSLGQPLYKLFGGAFRKRIPYYFYVPHKDLKADG